MIAKTRYSPLVPADAEALVPVLHNDLVHAFIGGLPSRDDFVLGLRRAIAGPPADRVDEHWLNHGARSVATGELVGWVQATVHDGLAEVAFLYSPSVWGRGHATEGLRWLHDALRRFERVGTFWATTHPDNSRSAALLRRCGYVEAPTVGLPRLYSYDDGDRVFCRAAASSGGPAVDAIDAAFPAASPTAGDGTRRSSGRFPD